MHNIEDLFGELFGKKENRQAALLYLASLMSHTEDKQELAVKLHQTQSLQQYLESSDVPDKKYYLEKVSSVTQIVEKELSEL